MRKNREERVLQWALEAGLLKRVKRSGWWCSGIKDPESVSDHSHRCALLAFTIAAEEGGDAFRASALAFFHDLPETRLSEAHAVVKRYWTRIAQDEARARDEQNAVRPDGPARRLIAALGREWVQGRSLEARAARDADYLECAIQALEYLWQEKSTAREWLDSNLRRLQTPMGRRLGSRLKALYLKGDWEDFRVWWKSIYRR